MNNAEAKAIRFHKLSEAVSFLYAQSQEEIFKTIKLLDDYRMNIYEVDIICKLSLLTMIDLRTLSIVYIQAKKNMKTQEEWDDIHKVMSNTLFRQLVNVSRAFDKVVDEYKKYFKSVVQR